MAERDELLTALVAEVLGPRGGAQEVLRADEDPLDEYITGVLAPHHAASVEIDADEDLVGDDDSMADDQADPGQTVPPARIDLAGLPTPSLDPRSRPASLGLSFTVQGNPPAVEFCCIWARYKQTTGGAWQRQARGQVWEGIDCSTDHSFTPTSDPGIRVQVRVRRSGTRWRVSIFLINVTPCTERPGTEEHVFQPQIRVCCSTGTDLVPIDDDRERRDDPEERSLMLLFRGRRSFARGHLCSATWREIDPERPTVQLPAPAAQPFQWLDGVALFDATVRARFSPAAVRTEYLPVFPVNAPEKTWPAGLVGPQLDPDVLCEAWDPAEIRSSLEPLADGYEGWIRDREQELGALAGPELQSAQAHLATCRQILGRIRAGIALLGSDDDARLAFCFANRAIAMQSRWARGLVNPWWPFQLAFQLVNLPALADRAHPDRAICDLLWFPTGGGKTEAYLGLAAFIMAHRRLAARRRGLVGGGAGVAVLSRYTLRLLTIQQFRRALAVVTACELLRVDRGSGAMGWRPRKCPDRTDGLWGGQRFAVGLWVGGGVTPNGLQDFTYKDRSGRLVTVRGALSVLEGRGEGEGEPAQVLTCPACQAILAVAPDGVARGSTITLHLVFGDAANVSPPPGPTQLAQTPFTVVQTSVSVHRDPKYCTLTLDITLTEDARPETIDSWVREHVVRALGTNAWLASARGSRPGYFIRTLRWGRARSDKPIDFEIFCPNPRCDLNHGVDWEESTPCGAWPQTAAFASTPGRLTRCPIPASTVDEQLYQWCPSMVVSTVDKFARLPFEPRAAALFGNVERFNEHLGYFRRWCAPMGPSTSLPSAPQDMPGFGRVVAVPRHAPPDLILQDELHLIEGPLGSMVGLYESAVDMLASSIDGGSRRHAKYIASTATVRNADTQVRSLFARSLQVFPPPGLNADDSFFARTGTAHPLDSNVPGRLYVGICAPGRGAQTPIIRIWSRLLQHLGDRRGAGVAPQLLDPFWTLVGYFNAIRELAGAVALTRQDIVQRLSTIGAPPRLPDEDEPIELSSRANSMSLPSLLNHLQVPLGGQGTAVNVAVATSMFGTGVDVERLGLMVVHGQPKTTSAYIQATGRVGRRQGGLVATFFRASRPRDLNHYEFFCAYHGSLYRYVEPITVNPFAPRARDRGLGPVAVALLRQASDLDGVVAPAPVHERWRVQQRIQRGIHCLAHEMSQRRRDADVEALSPLLERRAQMQPGLRRPPAQDTETHANSELDLWQQLAARSGGSLVYHESTLINPPSRPVVLGDLAHEVARTGVAFEDAPNSLRDVESTVTIRGWR
jgi:hypothetical protein